MDLSAPIQARHVSKDGPSLAYTTSSKSTRKLLLALSAFLILSNVFHLRAMIERMPDNDFGKTYYSTVAFLSGGDMYGVTPATPSGSVNGETVHLWNLNPPHFQMLVLPLALLPPSPALALWCLLNGSALVLSVVWIARELRPTAGERQIALVGLLAFVGISTSLLSGHCSFLLLMLVTGMWLEARHGRWTRAGLYLGLAMSFKPFLLLFVPYLVLRRRWDALAAALGMSVCCFAAGLAVFGVDNHSAWYARLGASATWTWQLTNGSLHGLLARTLTANPVSAPVANLSPAIVSLAWLALGIPIGAATLAASALDAGLGSVDRAFGILLTAALVLSPLGWTYYFCLPLGPLGAWLRSRDNDAPWGRRLFLTVLLALMLPPFVAGLFQPHALATLLIGNIYSYSALAVWAVLLVDGLRSARWRQQGDLCLPH